jgi:hypothetical protein
LVGETKYLEKACSIATSSITDHAWPDIGSNLVCRGGKPVTNHQLGLYIVDGE